MPGAPDWMTDARGRAVYLRVGDWDPARPWSYNHAMGEREAGLSAYDLDPDGVPRIPDEAEWAEVDMRHRLADDSLPKHLVVGRLVGQGHDGEPLLDQVEIIGTWEPRYPWPTGPSPC